MTEQTFVRELERQAEHVRGAPLSFEDVRGKAHSIRRRRRSAAAGAVAAVVAAVIVVPAVLSGGPGSKAPEPAPPLPTSPGASVLHDGVLTLPDGSTSQLGVDNDAVMQLGVLTDGRAVLALQDPYAVRVYAADGTLQEEYPVRLNAITMSADDDAVAWIAADSTIRVLSSGEATPTELPGIPMPGEAVGSIEAVLDADRLLVGDYNTTTGEVTPAGFREITTSEPMQVRDVSPDGSLWAVDLARSSSNEQFGCAALYDPEAAQVLAQSCETSFLAFSPDGQHLLGSRGDNAMLGSATVLDLDLEVVGRWESEGRGDVIKSVAWADAGHLLVSEANWKDNAWTLNRVDLAWSEREVLDGPIEGGNPEMVNEFLLSN
ncbi:MAG: hypothetical protein WBP61_04055 [Nocardioides sp.]